jgi:hypothetical protein
MYHKKKGLETRKNNKFIKTFIYNDDAPQNRGSMNFLQIYRHLLFIKNTQNS